MGACISPPAALAAHRSGQGRGGRGRNGRRRGAAARAAQTIDRLFSVFLGRPVPGGWIDHVDASGAPLVDGMPASTLYHVFLAAAEADRLWGERTPEGHEQRGDPAGGDPGGRQGHAARRDHAPSLPKPMLPIAGDRPFLDYLLEMIERHGYEDILLLGGYLGEVLEAAYDGRRIGGATIRVLREKVPLGTAGALTIARDDARPPLPHDERRRVLRHQSARAGAGLARERRDSDARAALGSKRRALRARRRGAGQGRRVPRKGCEQARARASSMAGSMC